MSAYFSAMARFGDFDGRSSRADFWFYMIFAAAIIAAARYAQIAWHMSVPLGDLVSLVHIIPSTTAQIRRLHDTGRSGYWLWLGLTVVGIIPLFYWYCQRSTAGAGPHGQAALRFAQDHPIRSQTVAAPGGDLGQAVSQYGQDRATGSANGSARSRGLGLSVPVALGLAGAGLVLTVALGKDQILRTIAIIEASVGPTAVGDADVMTALKARALDQSVVITGAADDSVLNGITVPVVATCLGRQLTHRSGGSDLTFYADQDSYRLSGADLSGHTLQVRFATLMPHIVRVDQIRTDKGSSDDPTTINSVLTWFLYACLNPQPK